MKALLRAELLKQGSTRTGLGLFAAMLGLVLLAVLLHSLLPAEDLARRNSQLVVLGRGEFLGTLFAALLGALFVLGAGAAGALWAAIGVGVGALVRHQVPTMIGICAWLLFVEGLLAGDLVGLGEVGRYLPGAAAAAISGQEPGTLLAPAAGLVLLALYAAVAALAGWFATSRRDVV